MEDGWMDGWMAADDDLHLDFGWCLYSPYWYRDGWMNLMGGKSTGHQPDELKWMSSRPTRPEPPDQGLRGVTP